MSTSNPMEKGACNSVHYKYYGQNSNMASSVTNWLHHSFAPERYIHWMNFFSIILCESSAASTQEDRHKSKVKLGAVKQSYFVRLSIVEKDCLCNYSSFMHQLCFHSFAILEHVPLNNILIRKFKSYYYSTW